jgi:hypothetical protein
MIAKKGAKQPVKKNSAKQPDRRATLVAGIVELAQVAIFGSASETYRTCGNVTCRCHGEGPKHGPHMYVSYKGGAGKTTGYYVPKAAHEQVRDGIAAWRKLQEALRELAELNRAAVLDAAREERAAE